MKAVRTSETSVDNNFTRQYIPEDNSEHGLHIFLHSMWVLQLQGKAVPQHTYGSAGGEDV
jgi:hypothetical protein